jgi:hypothetical protein
MIGKPARCFSRPFVLVAALGLTLALGGCGGDDEDTDTAAATTPATETRAEETGASEPETEAETEAESETEAPEAPETETGFTPTPEHQREEEGGDEEPARSLALFSGRGGRIRPRVIRVPAFISVRVELRSDDGRDYALEFNGEALAVRGGLASVSRAFDGLRPGEALVGRPLGAGNGVRVEATAEPGP